ncbi:hypothetical protein QVN49_08280 [Megasphaera hexanoica]|nr:hypothetical protein [Megasphaera hexanoica]
MGCCVGDCCVIDCGFCCIFDCGDCGDMKLEQVVTVDHATKTSNELDEKRKLAREEGEKEGDAVFSNINQFMKLFIEELKKINEGTYGGKKLNIKIDIIEIEFKKLRQEVTGFIGKRMEDRLVQTDKELSIILQEPDDDERAKNFEAFYQKVRRKAILDLSDKIEEVIAKQFAIVDSEIRNRLKEVDLSMKNALNEYEQAEKLKKENSIELARKDIDSMYKMTVANILLNELNGNIE